MFHPTEHNKTLGLQLRSNIKGEVGKKLQKVVTEFELYHFLCSLCYTFVKWGVSIAFFMPEINKMRNNHYFYFEVFETERILKTDLGMCK